MKIITGPIRNTLNFLDQPFIYYSLRIALIVYVIALLPQFSEDVMKVVDSPVGKSVILAVITAIYLKDQNLAMLLAIVLILTIVEYKTNSFPQTVVDESGNVIGTVLKGTTDIAAKIGETTSKVFGASGRVAGDVIKTVGKGASDIVGVGAELTQTVLETSANVSGDVVKSVSETVQKIGTGSDVVENYCNYGSCTM